MTSLHTWIIQGRNLWLLVSFVCCFYVRNVRQSFFSRNHITSANGKMSNSKIYQKAQNIIPKLYRSPKLLPIYGIFCSSYSCSFFSLIQCTDVRGYMYYLPLRFIITFVSAAFFFLQKKSISNTKTGKLDIISRVTILNNFSILPPKLCVIDFIPCLVNKTLTLPYVLYICVVYTFNN